MSNPGGMPFHISAQARLQDYTRIHFGLVPVSMPDRVYAADALACLRELNEGLPAEVALPVSGILDAHYAMVLRRGWAQDEMAVAVATSNSRAGHIHFDYGSVTIGAFGRWLIADPGLPAVHARDEREFTIGATAHNAPVLNGRLAAKGWQDRRTGERGQRHLQTEGRHDRLANAPEAGASLVSRTIWLWGRNLVIIADQIEARDQDHCVSLARRPRGGMADRARVGCYTPDQRPCCGSGKPFTVDLRSGPRPPAGFTSQMTLSTQGKAGPVIWWVFSLGESKPAWKSHPTVAQSKFPAAGSLLKP